MRTIFSEKDTPTIRANIQSRGIHPHLHLRNCGVNQDQFHMPHASYVLTGDDKAKVLRVMKSLKTPKDYVLALHKKISKGKLSGLKSHDFHMLLQQILPLCYRKISNKALAMAIFGLANYSESFVQRQLTAMRRSKGCKIQLR